MMTSTAPGDLTSTQWQVADAIARQLAIEETDLNEFRKSIAYLRAYSAREDAGKKFFDYLNVMTRNGDRIGHSKKTRSYLESITQTCQKFLSSYQDDADAMLQVLGWAARLMQYYKESPVGEIERVSADDIPSEAQQLRQEKIEQLLESGPLEVGKELEAKVLEKKTTGSKVKYGVAGVDYNEGEKKNFKKIPDTGPVIVVIKSLKEDGSINHVKFVRIAEA